MYFFDLIDVRARLRLELHQVLLVTDKSHCGGNYPEFVHAPARVDCYNHRG